MIPIRKFGQGLEVSAIGLGCMGMRCAYGTPPDREELIPTLEEPGIGFVPFSSLGEGFLTGKIDASTPVEKNDFRNIVPRFTPEACFAGDVRVDPLFQTPPPARGLGASVTFEPCSRTAWCGARPARSTGTARCPTRR